MSIIEVKEDRYFAKIWFGHMDGCDLLAALWRDPGQPWMLTYRFRYYASPSADDPNDVKRAYQAQLPPDVDDERAALEQVNPIFRELVTVMAQHRSAKAAITLEEIPVHSASADKLIDILKQQPWAHFSSTPK